MKITASFGRNFRFIISLMLIGFCVFPVSIMAQLSVGGEPLMPESGLFQREGMIVELPVPDVNQLIEQDRFAEAEGLPERMGVNIPVSISTAESGKILESNGSNVTWCINIRAAGATGLGLYFSDFRLPEGSRLFVYAEDKTQILGAYTSLNNQPDGFFAVEVVKGESLIVEYSCPASAYDKPAFRISEVLYVYKPMLFPGDRALKQTVSGYCEVNAACSEGNNWRNQINSVVRILIKNGSASYWCTGALVNNTASDFAPLLLTADHCARTYNNTYASPDDVSQWIFYFQYETPGCDNAVVQDNKTLTGAVKLASSSLLGNNGSDFYLVSLNDPVPASFSPFFAGWDRTGALSPSGFGIHHPSGDVKKISTYTDALSSDQWGSVPGTHYRVIWSETENGHGVTEGGSSGSPIFDNQGKIIGQLTGGESDCSNLTSPDYFGQIAYSWESNGEEDSTRLKPWLDPLNTGLSELDGISYVLSFKSDTNAIAVGRSVSFYDMSTISPTSWKWNFEGGDPETSTEQNPSGIKYKNIGKFNVKLTVANESGEFSIVREDYIKVLPVVVYDQDNHEYKVLLGDTGSQTNNLSVSDYLGRVVLEIEDFCHGEKTCKLDLSAYPSGVYFVTVSNGGYRETAKLMLIRN